MQDRPNTSLHLAVNSRLARRRPTKKSKSALSAKARTKREVTWKLRYFMSIKGVGSKGEIHTMISIPTHLETDIPRLRAL